MKALILKDIFYTKKQLKIFSLMILVAIFNTILRKETFLAMSYMIVIVSSIAITSISYDEIDNGYPALLSLPITKKEYVQSKFLGVSITGLLLLFIMGITTLFAHLNMDSAFKIQAWIFELVIVFVIFHIMVSASIPVMFKVGLENIRVASYITYALLFGLGFAMYKLLESSIFIDFKELLLLISDNMGIFILIILGATLIIYFISYRISIKIFQNKEF